jgi:hypothetical protein
MGIRSLAIDKSKRGRSLLPPVVIARSWTKALPFFRDSQKIPNIVMLQV